MKSYEIVLSSGKKVFATVHGEPNMEAVKKAVQEYAKELMKFDSNLIHLLEKEKMSDIAVSDKGLNKKTKKRVTQKGAHVYEKDY